MKSNKNKHILAVVLMVLQPIIWYFIYRITNSNNALTTTDVWAFICTITCLSTAVFILWYKESYLDN